MRKITCIKALKKVSELETQISCPFMKIAGEITRIMHISKWKKMES